jgi:predicted transcriptional regulator of viral defense system
MDGVRLSSIERAKAAFKRTGGLMRMSMAIKAGIHRDTLRKLVEEGEIQRVTRGLYQLVGAKQSTHPDLVIVASKAPEAVVCLISALSFHDLTTQIPHEVHVAVDRHAEPPRIDYPPIRVYRFSGAAFSEGIETRRIGTVHVKTYSREKTLADCFKYRNKIGLDTCLEALRTYKTQRRFNSDLLLKYAGVCRVTRVMRPYLEALL